MKKYNLMRAIILVLILIITYFWVAKNNNRLCEDDCANSLVVGTAGGYAPFVSMGLDGEYEGFDLDVARALAKEMDKKLVLQDLGSMSSLFTALNQGKIDVILWGMSITKERLQKVAMVHYEGDFITSYPLLFWEKIPAGVNSLTDLAGQTICVEPNSAQDQILSHYDQINRLFVEKVDDALLNVQYGKAVAALVEPAIAKKFQAKYPQIQVLNVPLAAQDQEQGVGIVIKPDNKQLIKQIQVAVQQLKATGVIAKFAKKWGI